MVSVMIHYCCSLLLYASIAVVFSAIAGEKLRLNSLFFTIAISLISTMIDGWIQDRAFLVVIPVSVIGLILIFKTVPFWERLYLAFFSVLFVSLTALLLDELFILLGSKIFLQEFLVNFLMIMISYVIYRSTVNTSLTADIMAVLKRRGPLFIVVFLLWYLFLWAYFRLLRSLEMKLLLETFYTNRYISHLLKIWKYLPGLSAIILLGLILVIIILNIVRYRAEEHQEALLYRNYIRILDSFVRQIKKDNHDYRHHIEHLKSIVLTSNSINAAKEQIGGYTEEIDQEFYFENAILSLADPVYKALFYGYYLKCKEENIDFLFDTTDLLPSFPLKDTQVVRVFGNLLSNAYEYTRMFSGSDERFIKVELFADQIHNRISITNPYKEASRLVTTDIIPKSEEISFEQEHGLGLISVKEILASANISFYEIKEKGNITFCVSYDNR